MTINKKILLVSSLSIISIAAIAGASAAILLKIKKDKNIVLNIIPMYCP